MGIWTHSRLTARQKCPMKEYLRYSEELVPLGMNQTLAIGTAIHKGIETRDIDAALAVFDAYQPSTQEEQDKLEVAKATTEAALRGYYERFPAFDEVKPELAFDLPVIDGRGRKSRKNHLCGKIDAIATVDGEQWLVEYKTAGRLDNGYFERLYVDQQITLYMYAAKRLGFDPKGVIYRVIKKPQLRRKVGESAVMFCNRLTADYLDRPDFYYTEVKLYRNNSDLDIFEKELWEQISQYETQNRKGIHIRHPCNCAVYGTCEYLPLCAHKPGAEVLFTRQKANSELEDNDAAN